MEKVPMSILECGVCLSLVCEPVSLSCGHTFCRTCLVSALRRSAKKCPCCRAVCHTRCDCITHLGNAIGGELTWALGYL